MTNLEPRVIASGTITLRMHKIAYDRLLCDLAGTQYSGSDYKTPEEINEARTVVEEAYGKRTVIHGPDESLEGTILPRDFGCRFAYFNGNSVSLRTYSWEDLILVHQQGTSPGDFYVFQTEEKPISIVNKGALFARIKAQRALKKAGIRR